MVVIYVAAAQEAIAEASTLGNYHENLGQARGHFSWKSGLPAPERVANRFEQVRQVEAKSACRAPGIVDECRAWAGDASHALRAAH